MKIKKLLLLLLCLAILFCFLSSCNSAKTSEPIAEPEIITFYENGIEYEIKEDGTVKIISHDNNEI